MTILPHAFLKILDIIIIVHCQWHYFELHIKHFARVQENKIFIKYAMRYMPFSTMQVHVRGTRLLGTAKSQSPPERHYYN